MADALGVPDENADRSAGADSHVPSLHRAIVRSRVIHPSVAGAPAVRPRHCVDVPVVRLVPHDGSIRHDVVHARRRVGRPAQ